jgi:hypothetical protein
MSNSTVIQRPCGDAKKAGIKRYTPYHQYKIQHTLDIRFEGLSMNLENISNLRNVFLENKVWKVWDKKVWDRNNFLGFFELGS